MSRCPSCSTAVPDGARFCASCGASLETAPVAHPTKTAAPVRSSDPPSIHGRFLPGAHLGERYRIVGLLGRGGMGEVYRADDLELGQSVALKLLPEKLAADPTALGRLRSEVRTARQIAHPNVCRVYDIGQADGHVFLSMEYVDGDDLSHVLRRLGPPSKEKAVEIARQLCAGLAAAHESGVLHRDLKPANVMLDGRGKVRITDFGLAGLAEELEANPEKAGTPAYMAPEQLESGQVSVRSDVYSLGLLLYELFTGKQAFVGETLEELRRSRSSGSVPSMQSQNESIDPAIERAIMRCLETDPANRPPSAYAVLAALPGGDPLAAALAAGETPSPELVANARDAGGLRPPIAVGLLGAVVASLLVVYFVYSGTIVMPEQSPAVLSVVAGQLMEELGYEDLPPNSMSGYDLNSHGPGAEPRFRYWRRWSAGIFSPSGYHVPELFTLDGSTVGSDESAAVAMDSSGRLLSLRVTPGLARAAASSAPVDWTLLFRRAELDPAKATEIPPPDRPPVHCDELVAWRFDGAVEGEDPVVILGAVDGRQNYFDFWRLDASFEPIEKLQQFVTTFGGELYPRQAMLLFMVILAIRNWRASRGDRRNAVRCGLIIGGLYAFMEALASPISGLAGLDGIVEYTNVRMGHVLIHTIEGWVIYMAVEPYVRRVWPRMLVGLVRLLSGRWRDPAVGREVLIGVATGCALSCLLALLLAMDRPDADAMSRLPFWGDLWSMVSPLHYASLKAHRVAWAFIDAVFFAGVLVAIRVVVRHGLIAAVLGAVTLVAMVYKWGFIAQSDAPIWLMAMFSIVGGISVLLLYTRVGILAGAVTGFVLQPYTVIAAGFDGWFSPYVIAELAIPLALAAYGFWVALAGQPILKDMLGAPQR